MAKKKIVLTGGGTAGHVIPHFALLNWYKSQNLEPIYIGSKGMEKDLVLNKGLEFHQILAGKLRRSFKFQNFIDIFKVLTAILQSIFLLKRIKPQIIFSKGGYVSVPVAIAGKICGIPVITHESDLSPGLATRLITRFADLILYAFKQTGDQLPKDKSKWVGLPVRDELSKGDRQKGLAFLGLSEGRKKILVMGGSLGALKLNEAMEKALPGLVGTFDVIHLTGKGKVLNYSHPNYRQFEFLSEELADVLAVADLVVSRGGATALFEFLALKKPVLINPLEFASRGDQIHNGEAFVKNGWARMIRDKDLDSLSDSIRRLDKDSEEIIQAQIQYVGGLKFLIQTLEETFPNIFSRQNS